MGNCPCDCSVEYDYSDNAEVFRVKMVRARKEHVCCECGKKIKSRSLYEYVFGIWNGEPSIFKTCASCAVIRDDYCPSGAIYGHLAETIKECLGFDYNEEKGGE